MSVRGQGCESGRAARAGGARSGRELLWRCRALGSALALCVLAGCKDERPVAPTTQPVNESQELASNPGGDEGKAESAARKAGAPKAADATGFAPDAGDFTYDPSGRRDPFRSYEWEHMKHEVAHAQESGPLEQYDLSQLELLGVVWDVGRARALVQDPSGMSYVVAPGARMGKNDGLVTRIDDNLVVVRERYVDLYGNESTKDVEMRIRASDGG